jgi:hypothetical protein
MPLHRHSRSPESRRLNRTLLTASLLTLLTSILYLYMHHNLSLTLPLSNIDQETTGSIPTLPCPPAPLPTQPTPHRLPTTSERAPHEPLSPHTHQTQYSGRIRVRILSNRPIYGHAMLEGPLTWTQPIDHTGLITAENLPDGDYSITVRVEHHARLRFHFTITHGSLIDLGDIPIPKESRLELITPPLTQFDSATASLFCATHQRPPRPNTTHPRVRLHRTCHLNSTHIGVFHYQTSNHASEDNTSRSSTSSPYSQETDFNPTTYPPSCRTHHNTHRQPHSSPSP